jgi:DNA-binding NtrC family response regulator
VSQTDDVIQVCLAGRKVSSDWGLIQSLRSRCLVILVERVELLVQPSFLNRTHLLVLDCSGSAEVVPQVLPRLKEELPNLSVVLVDGGLSQKQIAGAFKEGVKDYFADPYDVALLLERMDSLCTQARVNRKEGG